MKDAQQDPVTAEAADTETKEPGRADTAEFRAVSPAEPPDETPEEDQDEPSGPAPEEEKSAHRLTRPDISLPRRDDPQKVRHEAPPSEETETATDTPAVPKANTSGQWTVPWRAEAAPSPQPTVQEPLPQQPRQPSPPPATVEEPAFSTLADQPWVQEAPAPPLADEAPAPPRVDRPLQEERPAQAERPQEERPAQAERPQEERPQEERPLQAERPQAPAERPLPQPPPAERPAPQPWAHEAFPQPQVERQWAEQRAPVEPVSEAHGSQARVSVEPEKRRKRGRGAIVSVVAALVLLAGLVTGQLVRPVPDPALDLTLATSGHTFPGSAPRLPWPAQGQSAVFVDGLGSMGSSGGSAPTPTASVAKVMTAYVFLRDHPLAADETGPTFTVSPEAAAQVPARRQREESLLGVTANQRLTQRKALESLMIISANDVAHELARWDAGTVPSFVDKMNETARSLGMTSTRYTDPSGYDSRTVSTAADQVKLLRAAMRIPAFGEIVNNRAYVPDDGGPARPGGNILLGQYGVVGGKTGYTDAAGGNFVFAARKRVAGVATLMVGAVMGQRSPSAMGAITAGQQLVASAGRALTSATLAPAGARVARVDDGLGGRTPLLAAAPVTVVGWGGLTVPVGITGDPPQRAASGERVGAVTAGPARVPLTLDRRLDGPSLLHRLIRLG